MKLNLGCFDNYLDGFVNLDIRKPADVVHDLNKTPWPFRHETFELIVAHDILEHLPDFAKFMNECHRIMQPGGTLDIVVPRPSDNFWIDPTHVRPYTEATFHLFCTGDHYEDSYLGIKPWSKVTTEALPRHQTPAVRALLVK